MQKIFLSILVLFLINFNGFSQEEDHDDYYLKSNYHSFSTGSTQYLLADRVNVRATASTKGEIVANIPIGTKVKILKESSQTLKLKGFEAPWYQVSFQTKDAKQTGYIWGGLIAEGYRKSGNNDGVTFYYGIAKVKTEKRGEYNYDEITLQLRAAKAGKELDKIEFDAVGSLETGHNMTNKGTKGLKNLDAILELAFSDQMCAGADGDVIVFWNNQKLYHIRTLYSGADIPVFSSENFIYPSDEGGKKDQILFVEEAGEHSSESDSILYDYQRKTAYRWTGSKLEKLK